MLRHRHLIVGLVVGLVASFAGTASLSAAPSESATLVGVDAVSGRPRWRAVIGGEHGASLNFLPFVDAGVVVALRERCLSEDRATYRPGDLRLLAFDATTGKQLWTRSDAAVAYTGYGSFGYQSSSGVVPVQTTSGRTQGLNLRTGKILWDRDATPPSASTGNLAFDDPFGFMGTVDDLLVYSNLGLIFTTGGDARVEAWQSQSGRNLWSVDLGSDRLATLATNGSELFALRLAPLPAVDGTAVPDFSMRVETLSLVDGNVVSELDLGVVPASYDPLDLVVTKTAFVTTAIDDPGKSIAFDRTSGTTLWQHPGLPAFAMGDTVFARQERPATVFALDASTGVQRWQLPGQAVKASGTNSIVVSNLHPDKPNERTVTAVAAATDAARWKRSNVSTGFVNTTRGTSVLASPGCLATNQR